MKIARLASLMLVAILAIGLVAASVASAADPEFLPLGATVTGTSGAGVLRGAGEEVKCESDVVPNGTVTSATLIGGIVVHFLNCTNKNGITGESCPARSTNTTTEGLILTNTLHGVLGLILPKPASGSNVALVLLPVSGSSFLTLTGKCIGVTGAVAGQVVAVVERVDAETLVGEIKFALPD